MHYLILAYDYQGEEGQRKRTAFRDQHVELVKQNQADGKMLYGAAILDDDGNMTGSMMVMAFSTQHDFQEYLDKEPYITGEVWEKVVITKCAVGPMFL